MENAPEPGKANKPRSKPTSRPTPKRKPSPTGKPAPKRPAASKPKPKSPANSSSASKSASSTPVKPVADKVIETPEVIEEVVEQTPEVVEDVVEDASEEVVDDPSGEAGEDASDDAAEAIDEADVADDEPEREPEAEDDVADEPEESGAVVEVSTTTSRFSLPKLSLPKLNVSGLGLATSTDEPAAEEPADATAAESADAVNGIEIVADEAPLDETPADEPVDEPTDETPADEETADEEAADEEAADEEAADDEAAADETADEETVVDDASAKKSEPESGEPEPDVVEDDATVEPEGESETAPAPHFDDLMAESAADESEGSIPEAAAPTATAVAAVAEKTPRPKPRLPKITLPKVTLPKVNLAGVSQSIKRAVQRPEKPAVDEPEVGTKASRSRPEPVAAPKAQPESTADDIVEAEIVEEPTTVAKTKKTKKAPARSRLETVLHVQGLTKSFGDNVAVNSIDLDVKVGSFYGIVGPNGAGKTTTLSMITGLLRPDEGTVEVHGSDVWSDPVLAKRNMGVLPDRLRLFDRLTGAQLLYYAGILRGLEQSTVRTRTRDLAGAFGLDEALGRLVSDYSAGMTKKIALAAAMIHSPRLLVLDEPFESVDPVSAATITDILKAYANAGGTVVLSSHSMDLVQRICDNVAVIVHGEILADGTIDEVRDGATLEERFVSLAGGRKTVEGLEWLHSFSD